MIQQQGVVLDQLRGEGFGEGSSAILKPQEAGIASCSTRCFEKKLRLERKQKQILLADIAVDTLQCPVWLVQE